ncbi:hypothetical protein F1728_06450 [Gimesia benthica]|uniref:Uncharacterized protein n=1 Tax=Gimesia benthica TaxID=2608982 RepID=A0A6I6A852_9PLAN|nr:hypothetical protein [Gimesia benthica]QGQ22333.1 hypothetical protein F1728_06450 [Gimesia benthica]
MKKFLGLSPENQVLRATVAILLLMVSCWSILGVTILTSLDILLSNSPMQNLNNDSYLLILAYAFTMSMVLLITIIDLLSMKKFKDALPQLIAIIFLNSLAIIAYWVYQLVNALKHLNDTADNN